MRPRRFLLLAPVVLSLACTPTGAPPEIPAQPTPPATAPGATTAAPPAKPDAPAPDFDPVAVGMTAAGVTKLCDDHLAAAQALIEAIKTLKGAPADQLTYDATLGRFDRVSLEMNDAAELPALMEVAHPDAAVREAAKTCAPKLDKVTTAMWLDATLAGVLKAYAAKNEKLDGPRARLLSDTLRDFRRNGLDLPADKQKELAQMNEELTALGQKFTSNIAASTGSVEVAEAALKGLPKEYVAGHPKGADGKIKITTDYPDYFPFVTYSPDRKAALELYTLFTNRGGDENVKLLERLLELRSKKAKLLGYATWADYAIEPRMAKTPKAVRAFLDELRAALKAPAKAEMAEFVKEHVRLGGKASDALPPSDRYYLEDQLRQRKYKFDSQELSAYFEIGAVKRGLMDITSKMYGLEYKPVAANAWHPDVEAYEVWSEGKKIGKFYLDLYSRPDKYKHAAMFPIVTGARLPDGRWQPPVAALECNFPKPGAEPALMSHDDVATFFHEFGHVLHHLLTTTELATYSGTATVRDFVEAPSQMFEEWVWSRDVLDLFARHYKTHEKIPDKLFDAMQRSRSFGRALSTQRQIFLATLDLEYHSREPGFDTTKVVEEVQNATDSFAYVKGTHFQSSFGHLIEYDAGYYGYQWALSLSRDVLTRFKKEGLLDPKVAADWRNEVLARGGGADEEQMVARFLGRPSSHKAYLDYLAGKD